MANKELFDYIKHIKQQHQIEIDKKYFASSLE
jgi:hypothetical protein